MVEENVKLTRFSHGAGCGCKISPKDLQEILAESNKEVFPGLLVGNDESDDAAVYDLGNGTSVISTTDFFMPIVDDPADFGRIASVNALSDIYAMGGKPLMAIAILGWPIDKLSTDIAKQVMEGAKATCSMAGIPIAGGHSIDNPEPVFGLAVTGLVQNENIKKNSSAKEGDYLYLTKPLGVGIITTAHKKEKADKSDLEGCVRSMLELNDIGFELGKLPYVNSITDVTGFGLLGHLIEMCNASQVSAEILFQQVPTMPNLEKYIEQGFYPGGTTRNLESYLGSVDVESQVQKLILADPQTSGGLLIAVDQANIDSFNELLRGKGISLYSFGRLTARKEKVITVN